MVRQPSLQGWPCELRGVAGILARLSSISCPGGDHLSLPSETHSPVLGRGQSLAKDEEMEHGVGAPLEDLRQTVTHLHQ